jgi:hypothetical protein
MSGESFGRRCAVLAVAAVMSCGTAGADDREVPKNQHHIQTVFIILMENHNWTGDGNRDIKGNPHAPYINQTLLPISSYANQYYNPPNNHPSLPNYLWLEAGTNFGIRNDGPPQRNSQRTKKHLVTLLENADITWKAYLENTTGSVCPLHDRGKIDQNGSPLYAVRHEPFAYFDDVTNNLDPHSRHCIEHLRPFKELATDLANDSVAQYNWITPNLCDDMHDSCRGSAIAHGDEWLSRNVPPILKSDAYKAGGALFIVWDEAAKGDGPIPMFVVSPFARGGGYSNGIYYTHGSMLRTMQEIFSVKPLLRDAGRETDLSDMFNQFP